MSVETAVATAPSIRPGLKVPDHLAVIMDGNGRWAQARGKVRTEGHVEGVKALRRVFAQPAFDRFRGVELAPGPDVVSDAEIERWLRATADTVFHPVGSCRMGNDAMAVVNQHLEVHGVGSLRVVDASIMPRMPSSNTHAPTMMIAERAADFILERAA